MTGQHKETSVPVVRISTGGFDPARTDEVVAALRASETTLRPAIAALPAWWPTSESTPTGSGKRML